jgi:hypothetical protein
MWNTDMAGLGWVSVNMVRALDASKHPSFGFKPLDKLFAIHIVYYTHCPFEVQIL